MPPTCLTQIRRQTCQPPPLPPPLAAVTVVVVPFPAQGHLNQLLQLARLISYYNIPVHYVTTITHNRQVNLRNTSSISSNKNNINFHELKTPIFDSPPPNPDASIKFPSHLQSSFEATSCLRVPVARLLKSLARESRRIIIIHDSLMGSVVQDFVTLPNAEAYTFHSVSAFTLFMFVWDSIGRPFAIDTEMIKDLPSLEGCFSPEFEKFVKSEHEYTKFSSGKIYNTCRYIEGHFLDLLSKEQISKGKKLWALGPFNPMNINNQTKGTTHVQQRHKSLIWLDNQDPKSVIFVSFGTTTSFSSEQINEIAMGLEKSQQKFIWVLREADRGNVFSKDVIKKIELPKGFEDKVNANGIIVRDWAPQLEILAHASTGGFMSHCGWNSCIESISMGVPMLAWPFHSDQPRNTVLITRILKVGVVVRDWARRHEVVGSTAVEEAVRMLMTSEEGAVMRRRAAELGCGLKNAVAEGGVTRKEFDSFIAHITRGI